MVQKILLEKLPKGTMHFVENIKENLYIVLSEYSGNFLKLPYILSYHYIHVFVNCYICLLQFLMFIICLQERKTVYCKKLGMKPNKLSLKRPRIYF